MSKTPESEVNLFKFDNSYLALPDVFYQPQLPTKVASPNTVIFNVSLASELGLNIKETSDLSSYFSGNTLFAGSQPIAQAYAGHQFGHFNRLGDGRAILLGEHITPQGGRYDVQLKGAGRTAYSRSGDGRAALAPMLREYLMSEAMHALNIPTTRSLAVVTTGENIYRGAPNHGAILTRVAASHVRVGTFQYAAATQNPDHVKLLADYVIKRHFSESINTENKYLNLLTLVIERQAKLVAQWMQVGFIHGVMNTDNMSICGETIDYGPCAMMNAYHPETVFSSIDTNGRYAYANQPDIAQWNLFRFAETLLPLLHNQPEKSIALATDCLNQFSSIFMTNWLDGMRKKMGIFNQAQEDLQLIEDLLIYMQRAKADFTNTFSALANAQMLESNLVNDTGFNHWLTRWHKRLSEQPHTMQESLQLMQSVNPKVIARNHLVEEALNAADVEGNLEPFNGLLAQLTQPYAVSQQVASKYTQPPTEEFDQQYQTFCGT